MLSWLSFELDSMALLYFVDSVLLSSVSDLMDVLATQTDENKIILGDCNINIQNKNQQTITNLCRDLKSQQLVKTPTTKYNTIIDHIHTNLKNFKTASVLKTYYSDHNQIFIQF